MSWAILADTNRIVRPNMKNGQTHERRQANGTAHVVSKYSESCSGRQKDTIITNSVYDRTHGMFANSEQEVATGIVVARKITLLLKVVLGRPVKIGRSTD